MVDLIQFALQYWYFVLPTAAALVLAVVLLARKGYLRKINFAGLELDLSGADEKKGGGPQLFDQSDSAEFAIHFEKLIPQSRRIILIGTGINILHRDPIFLALIERTQKGLCELEIYMANPFSPAVETRLIEEEAGEFKPPVGKRGLINRLNTILEKQHALGDPSNFTLKLFSHYPTFALFILDGEYFFYPYGMSRLGNFSPVAQYSRSNPHHQSMVNFLDQQYQRVKTSSVDARLVFDLHSGGKVGVERLQAFAVYFIPDAHSELYRFGSRVLGYDVRDRRFQAWPGSTWAGDAAEFGFHLTIADALYAINEPERDRLRKEVEYIAQDFQPFSLEFKLCPGFPDEHSISLVCQDSSGSLEALHTEMVFRCYRAAAASNYSLGQARVNRDRDQARAKLMIRRYRAPYILQRFKSHFTLLTNVPADQMQQVVQEVEKLYKEMVSVEEIEVQGIAFMSKPAVDQPWQILQEIPLG